MVEAGIETRLARIILSWKSEYRYDKLPIVVIDQLPWCHCIRLEYRGLSACMLATVTCTTYPVGGLQCMSRGLSLDKVGI